jgi:hypothetical protein
MRRAAVFSAAVLSAAGLLAASAGCTTTESRDSGPPTDSIDLPTIVMSARRPTRRFYIERTSDRCSVYYEDGGSRSPTEDAPCVQDLLLGERIRLVGSTCMREGASEARSLPVMCPNELSRFVNNTKKAQASSSAATSASASARAR